MSAGEFTRLVKLDRLPAEPVTVEADEAERAALAQRFGLSLIHALTATVELSAKDDTVDAMGRLRASFEQPCAVSQEPFANALDEPIVFRFVPALTGYGEEDEIEFDSDAPDEIEYEGAAIDLGEAVAQSFGLAIDPYAQGPEAERARRDAGLLDEDAQSGPFAALAALKKS